MASPGPDPAVRAAFLMANDLAVLLLRDQLTEVLGVDPLSQEGMARWASEVLAVYGSGLMPPPEPAPEPMPELSPESGADSKSEPEAGGAS